MGAFVNGNASWNFDAEIESPEFEKKYGPCLKELSKYVGAAANTGDVEAYQFLVHYTALIMQSGFELLKEVVDDEKSKNFEDFLKKVGVFNKK